jgi:hypothetical protein
MDEIPDGLDEPALRELARLHADAMRASQANPDGAARLLERRLRMRRPEDADATAAYQALDEILWEQLAAEAFEALGPEASQDDYQRWIRRRLGETLGIGGD